MIEINNKTASFRYDPAKKVAWITSTSERGIAQLLLKVQEANPKIEYRAIFLHVPSNPKLHFLITGEHLATLLSKSNEKRDEILKERIMTRLAKPDDKLERRVGTLMFSVASKRFLVMITGGKADLVSGVMTHEENPVDGAHRVLLSNIGVDINRKALVPVSSAATASRVDHNYLYLIDEEYKPERKNNAEFVWVSASGIASLDVTDSLRHVFDKDTRVQSLAEFEGKEFDNLVDEIVGS